MEVKDTQVQFAATVQYFMGH